MMRECLKARVVASLMLLATAMPAVADQSAKPTLACTEFPYSLVVAGKIR